MLFDFRIIFSLHLYFFRHHAVSGIHSFPHMVNDIMYIILNILNILIFKYECSSNLLHNKSHTTGLKRF